MRYFSYSNWADGVSTVPSTPIISQEVYFTNLENTSIKSTYVVDYVKIYQPSDEQDKKDIIHKT